MDDRDWSKYVIWSTPQLVEEQKRLNQQMDSADYREITRILELRKNTTEYQFAVGKKWHVDTTKRLPVFSIILEVFKRIHDRWNEYVRSLSLILLLSIAVQVVSTLVLNEHKILLVILLPFSCLASTLVAVTCHRLIALGADSVPSWGILTPEYSELRFFGYVWCFGFAIGLWAAVTGVPLAFVLSKMECCSAHKNVFVYGAIFCVLLIPVLIYG